VAEWSLREGIADIIAMGRALIADPYLPEKAAEGRLEDIVPCICCLECVQAVGQGIAVPTGSAVGTLRCSVNPAVGREHDCAVAHSSSKKRVFVVGGGPAGMEAARVTRLRGHDVTLVEKDTQLGGQLLPAAAPPCKEAISLLTDYYASQLEKLGVKVMLGREATPGSIAEAQADAVIWAPGALAVKPDVPGLDGAGVVRASDVLTGKAAVGDSVVVIGAELVGCETANYLADQGRKVTVVRRGQQVLAKAELLTQIRLLDDLGRKGVGLLTGVKYEGFDGTALKIRTDTGQVRKLVADTYVLAAGARSNTDRVLGLKQTFDDVRVIGDAVEPRRIRNAIAEGFEAGRTV
jgi:pyruvate/2-oxoglutarate dehydrogenase complex dihydrolipoamide dehydrogenase (E3) component